MTPAAFADLAVGASVTLRREPDNAYDRRAIEVLDAAGRKLGSVARIDNSALAHVIDAGEPFEARVARLTPPLDWVRGWKGVGRHRVGGAYILRLTRRRC